MLPLLQLLGFVTQLILFVAFFHHYSNINMTTAGVGIPICVQCGTTANPCRCKVVGPTLGFLAFAAAALVDWPLGALLYCFRHAKGRRIMAHPAAVVYPSVSNAFPI